MTDYRRIDADALVTQARALDNLAGELELIARRLSDTLAIVGRSAPTTPLTDAAGWLNAWSSTMTRKAAIAEEAVTLPASPSPVFGAAQEPGPRAVLRTVRVPRWVERPMLTLQEVTRSVTRAVAQTALVEEMRTVTERVLERVPVWSPVTLYREVLKPFTTWRAVQERQFVPEQVTVYETEYRQIAQYVSVVVPLYRVITHVFWNGWQFVTQVIPIVTYQTVSRVEYVTIPVRTARTVTRWLERWVTRYEPVTEWRPVLESYQASVRSWVDHWVIRPAQQIVTVPRRVIASVTRVETAQQSTLSTRGEWVWDEQTIVEAAPATPADAPPAAQAPTGAGTDPLPPPSSASAVTRPRPTGDQFAALNGIGATADEVDAYRVASAQESAQRLWATPGEPAGRALTRSVTAVAGVYRNAQQGSLGFFTGDDPVDSVQRAVEGLKGDARYSPADLGFARLASPHSRQQELLAAAGEQLVDPLTLGTAGGGLSLRVFTGASILAGAAASEVTAALGGNARQQQLAHLVGATLTGLGSAAAVARQASVRAAQAFEAANAIRVGEVVAELKAASGARLAELFTEPRVAAQALRSTERGSTEAAEIAALLGRDAAHIQGSANRVVLGKAAEDGGYIAEARARGGVWYESSPGVYETAGTDATWATNEAFLLDGMQAGVGRIEFHGMDVATETARFAGEPLQNVPARIKEVQFLSDHAEAFGYVKSGNGYQLPDTLAAPIADEVGVAAAIGTAAESARQGDDIRDAASQ
ncbi:MAG: hypothetical protein O2843_02025 [Chloroflexi bacterium]|nr:hypothetical protein [Chloroflexota bacterium]